MWKRNQSNRHVVVSVLGYIEDGDWVAHALEMDVIGVGSTWKEALSALDENIQAQVSFAKYRGDDSLIFQPAPAEFFEKFREAQEATLRALVDKRRGQGSLANSPMSGYLPVPKNIPTGDYAAAL